MVACNKNKIYVEAPRRCWYSHDKTLKIAVQILQRRENHFLGIHHLIRPSQQPVTYLP